MRPKDYFNKYTAQEEPGYIFTLLPSEFAEHVNTCIKNPLEQIVAEGGNAICESYLDFKPGKDHLEEIWQGIQRANIVVANITGFKPSVMLELGVALVKKENVFLIAERKQDEKIQLPFNISTLGVKFYEPDKLEELSNWLTKEIKKILSHEGPILPPDAVRLMHTIQKHRRNEDFDTVFILFEKINQISENNWYIFKEWGITYEKLKHYDEAISKLNIALEYATSDKQKSEIYTALGTVYRKHEKTNLALTSFQKAENLDSDSAELYDKWAFLYYTMGNFQEATNKMMTAVKRDADNMEYGYKLQYYTKRFSNRNFRMSLREYLLEVTQTYASRPVEKISASSDRTRNDKVTDRRFKNFASKYNAKNRDEVEGVISNVVSHLGVFVDFPEGVTGLIFRRFLPPNFDVGNKFRKGDKIRTKVIFYDYEKLKIQLDLA